MRFIPTLPWKKSMVGSGLLVGRKPDVRFFWRMSDETRWIVSTIREIRKQNPRLTIAILSRTNLDLFRCEEEFLTETIPYRLRDCGREEDDTNEGNSVDLVTLHASKGLEWDVVFLIHCNDEVFPSSKRKEQIICERRLFYVAVTRARKHLFLSYNRQERDLSRFIREIPSRLLQYHGLARYCLSEAELQEGVPTLESLINSLDGADFKYLRDSKLLDWLDIQNIQERNIFPPGEIWTTPRWASKPDVAKDFLRFVRTFVKRSIARYSSEKIYRDPVAERLLFTLRIFSEDREFWEEWRDELLTFVYTKFRGDEAAKVPPPIDYATMMEWCQASGLDWTPQQILAATSLVAKIRGQLRPLRFETYDLNEFTIAPCRFSVPTELRGEILRSWRQMTNLEIPNTDILTDIWRVSTLSLVGEGRNAPLYRVSSMSTYLEDMELGEYLHTLEASLEKWMHDTTDWLVGLEIQSEWTQPETIDLFAAGVFWKLAGEDKERISSMKLLLLAITAGFAQKQGIRVHSIGMLYPLEGRCITVRLPMGWCDLVDSILQRCLHATP
jgi:hypothetical protein